MKLFALFSSARHYTEYASTQSTICWTTDRRAKSIIRYCNFYYPFNSVVTCDIRNPRKNLSVSIQSTVQVCRNLSN